MRLVFWFALFVVAATLAYSPITVLAASDEAVLEEIVVTARKKEEPLQETPVAVTALTSQAIERMNATDLVDLHLRAPNVLVSTTGSFNSSASVFMRGIGNADIDSTIDPPVAILVDGVYIPRPANNALDLFDVEQIEVLRGPQGTLFGRNTTAGAIHYRTRRPSGELGMRANITVGEYGRRDLRVAAEAPIVEDKFNAKVAVFSQEYDGYFRNTFMGAAGNRTSRDAGGTDSLAIRPMLHFTPSDTFELTIIGEYLRERSEPNVGINVSRPTQLLQIFHGNPPSFAYGEDARRFAFNVPGFVDNDIKGVTVEAVWDVGPGTLTAIGNWRDTESEVSTDIDMTSAPLFEILRDEPHEQKSAEIRYNFDINENINFTGGLYFFEQEYFLRRDTFLDVTNTGTTTHLNAITGQDHENTAIFAQIDWYLTEDLRMTLGGRYTQEDKDFYATLFAPFPTLSTRFELDDDWSNFGPKIGFDYQISDNGMVYFTYSRGFKSGGMNGRGGTPGALGPFDEEEVDAYEVGIKADWLDNRLRTNVAIFRNEYADLQRTVIRNLPGAANPQETVTANAADATVQGLELEVVAVPTPGMTLNLALGYNDAEYDDFLADLNGDTVVTDNSGIDLQRAPELTAALGFAYDFDLGDAGTLGFTADWVYVDEQNNLASGAATGEIDSYDLLDLGLRWTPVNESYYVSFWIKNATDEVYQNSFTPVAALFDFNHISPPRRWGLTVGVDL